MSQLRVADQAADTPRAALSVLGLRTTLTTSGILLGLAGLAWYLTWRQTTGMMTADLTGPVFMAMWLTMMVAMMFPTIGPMVLAHRHVVLRRSGGNLPTVAFVAGYLSIWFAAGLVPLAGLIAFRAVAPAVLGSLWLPVAAGAALVVAGLYQFTPWKGICLKACRTPLGFVMTHDFGGGSPAAYRAGLSHGLYCLGCCWALMAVLVIVGLMNLAWMAVIAIVFLLEKNWSRGVALSRLSGLAVVALGVAVIAFPRLLFWLASGLPPSPMGGQM